MQGRTVVITYKSCAKRRGEDINYNCDFEVTWKDRNLN